MSTRVTDETTADAPSSEPTGTETIESYKTDDGVVFYDAENPLAWVETTRTISLKETV